MTEANFIDLYDLVFVIGCIVAFGLGCLKGGQR